MKDIEVRVENHVAKIVLKGQDITDLVTRMYMDHSGSTNILHLEIPLLDNYEIVSG